MSNHTWPHRNIQVVMSTADAKFMMSPVEAMSRIVILRVAQTMAFGGVATGSIKAQLAASVAGTIRVTGASWREQARSPRIGSSTLAVAVLLVTSVRKVTSSTAANTTRSVGAPWRTDSCWPSHSESPVALKPVASAKPPPKSSRMCHGVLRSVGQSISHLDSPLASLAGIIKRRIAIATEIVSSPSLALLRPSAWQTGLRTIQARTVRLKTIATRTSAWLMGPSLSLTASRAGWPAGRSARGTRKRKISMIQIKRTIISESGAAKASHLANVIVTSKVSAWEASTPFGGVPMIVPRPPVLALYASPSRSALPKGLRASLLSSNEETIASTIGNSMSVVLVFERNMLRKAVASMMPNMRQGGRVPMQRITPRASRLWSPVRSSAKASWKPPKKSHMMLVE
mmetsp:Transcript_78801/g.222813  ORF Transcript_78801/g.222813 Transcript_78801/m.222813 type:complete len:400 (-) Transcript_78801:416-1615(-)